MHVAKPSSSGSQVKQVNPEIAFVIVQIPQAQKATIA